MRKLTSKEFLTKAKNIHKDKYNYSLVEYVNTYTKVEIICKTHGPFKQTPANHFKNKGCPKCAGLNKTTEEFIKEARKIHGNRYDYSLSKYKNAKIKIIIICPTHGEFQQVVNSHLVSGCPKCAIINKANKLKSTKQQFIKKAQKIHGNTYDYSLVDYVNARTKIKIICKKTWNFRAKSKSSLKTWQLPKM